MSTYQVPNVNNKIPQLIDDGFYTNIKVDKTVYAPTIYVGLHLNRTAASSEDGWKIIKVVPNGADVDVTTFYGIFDNRNSL
jgi:hypothetical protein